MASNDGLSHHSRPIAGQLSTFEWNTVLRTSPPHVALSLYLRRMLPSGAIPNKFTFTFLLRSSVSVSAAVALLHAHLTVLGLHCDPFLRSALVSAYSSPGALPPPSPDVFLRLAGPHPDAVLLTALASALARCCRLPDAALAAFASIPDPSPVSFAALVSALSDGGFHRQALAAFHRARARAPPTEAALVSALSSAAQLGALIHGEFAHRDALLRCRPLSPALGTALLVFYSKCGRLDFASKVFDEMPHKDQPCWAAMINALASHGYGEEALRLFDEMQRRGIVPDGVTYVGVLHACSHAGLVEDARKYFDRMVSSHGIEPSAEHYGCLVDAAGRCGKVEEAWELVRSMPMAPDERALKSLLSACCHHRFAEYAEWAAERLVRMYGGNASSYVLLSNMYAGMGRWEDYARVRKLMRIRGVPKESGFSSTD